MVNCKTDVKCGEPTIHMLFEPKRLDIDKTDPVLPIFLKPRSSVKLFNSVFPLPKGLYLKWCKGIVLRCSQPAVRHNKLRADSRSEIAVTQRLLEAKIIEECPNGPYMAYLFNIPKAPNTVRPIVDLSRISKQMDTPEMELCSLFQLADRRDREAWACNLWYVKFDFSQAFYNIPVKRASRRFLAFKVGKKYYRFRVLPFGLGMAPFACQTFLEAILRYIHKRLPRGSFAYGYIDDILIGARSKKALIRIVRDLLYKFEQVKWPINADKCVLIPQRIIVFLGSEWGGSGIRRNVGVSSGVITLIRMLGSATRPLSLERRQIVAGYLNYYMQFAGKLHTVVQRLVDSAGVDRKRARGLAVFLMEQCATDFIGFRSPSRGVLTVYADATPTKLAAIIIYDEKVTLGPEEILEALKKGTLKQGQSKILQLEVDETPIIETEIRAIFLALENIEAGGRFYRYRIGLFTDSMPALYFFEKGSSKFSTWDDDILCRLLAQRNRLSIYFDLEIKYVNTKLNPADYYSRTGSVDVDEC